MRTDVNVRQTERWATAVTVTAVAAIGAGLIWRARARSRDTRSALGGSAGTSAEDAVTINRPASELYQSWRRLEPLARLIPHLDAVQTIDERRSHWIAEGPRGTRVEWDAEIINDIPNELIAWRTVGEADVVSAGSVHFTRASGGRGTVVRVRFQYDPPAGKLGALAAWIIGRDPSASLREGLRRFKQLTEAGEIARSA